MIGRSHKTSMVNRLSKRVGSLLLAIAAVFLIAVPSAQAFDNPDLLPEKYTAIIDLANVLTDTEEGKLENEIAVLEEDTGWKLRVLTQYDRTPGRAIQDYWNLDAKSLLVVADSRGGNLLNFNVGGDYYKIFPRTFWIELQTRFGNQFYVRDNGEDRAVLDSIASLDGCLRQGGCSVVPGLPQEQWIFTLISSILGGVICGFAAHPRKPGGPVAWQWALLFSPLWGILFLAFGLGPVVTRTHEWLPISRNVIGFMVGVLAAYLTYQFREEQPEGES